jgi:hypothetical protein
MPKVNTSLPAGSGRTVFSRWVHIGGCHVTPRHVELTIAVEAHQANAALAGLDAAAMRASLAAHSAAGLGAVQGSGFCQGIQFFLNCAHAI